MPRYFKLHEAQELLPRVADLVSRVKDIHARHAEAEAGLSEIARQVHLMGGMRVDPARVSALRNLRERMAGALREAVEAIQELGVQLKDIELGLVDFPTLYRGREVLLCWKLGEHSIEFWHGLDEGFRGRKRIDRDFLLHHGAEPDEF
jgi:hypothetical protein